MVRGRSALAYVIPIFCGVIFLGAEVLSSLVRDQEHAQTLQAQVSEIDVIGDLVHELQRERGYSAGVLASNGRRLQGELFDQRDRTDATMLRLRQTWGLSNNSAMENTVLQQLLSLRTLRRLTDDRAVTSREIVTRYSTVVSELLAAGIVTPHSVNSEIRLNMLTSALQAVSLAKDAAGLQRATGASLLANPGMAEELRGTFLSYGAQEAAFLGLAAIHLRDIQDVIFPNTIAEPHDVAQLRALILDADRNAAISRDVTPEMWFATSTDWIDRLRDIERDLQARIDDTARVLQRETRTQLMVNGSAVGLALLLLSLQLLYPPSAPKSRNEAAWAEDS